MKVKNPNKATAKAPAIEANRAAVLAFINARADEETDFADIRAAMPAPRRAEITDGVIHAICNDAGLTVEP